MGLKSRGLNVFFDKECLPGGSFGDALTRIIDGCKVMVPIITREYLDIERMNKRGKWEGKTDYCFEELKQALEKKTMAVIPFVEVGFYESILPDAETCFTF